jgi:hypothetical protein
MKAKLRRLGASAAIFAIAATGMVVLADPASASYSDCPTNYLCLWAGTGGSGALLFKGNGTTMHNSGDYYTSPGLSSGVGAYSSNNRTLGRFCTYSSSLVKTNVLNAQTVGNIASHNTYYVKSC